MCVCVIIWKEACSYRNSLLGFWRWANIQPMKAKPSGGRWFNVSSIPNSMLSLKTRCRQVVFGCLHSVSKKSPLWCENSCVILWQIYIYVLHSCGWHGAWVRLRITHTETQVFGQSSFAMQGVIFGVIYKMLRCHSSRFTIKNQRQQKKQRLDYESSSSTLNESDMISGSWEKYPLLVSDNVCCYMIHTSSPYLEPTFHRH